MKDNESMNILIEWFEYNRIFGRESHSIWGISPATLLQTARNRIFASLAYAIAST